MKNTLEKRIILFAFLILFLTILANTGMDIAAYRRDYLHALIFSSQSLGAALKGNVEKVTRLGIDVRDIPEINDKCREVVESNPPLGDYCIITDAEGRVLYLNDPDFRDLRFENVVKSVRSDSAKQVRVIRRGSDRFFDTVTPIRTAEGKVVAVAHIGFPESEVTSRVQTIVLRSLLILAFSFLVAFTLVIIFVKRSIIQPISSLLHGVKKISEGSFDTRIEEVKVYEFSELAKNINFMSESLKYREEEIQKNYKELEGTHQKLRTSYQQLEKLSLELERSEDLYKSLMEDSSDAILVVGGDEQVKMVNKMAEDFFGYTAQEVVGLPLTKLLLLLNIENVPRIHKIFREGLNGRHLADEMQFVKKGGEAVLGRVNISSIRSESQALVQAIFRDITKEREILNNLGKSAADLARLNKMKDSFLGLASHELKTPLTVIMGYAELILTDMADKMEPTVVEMVENIANAASRLDNIVKDMVDVSMIDEKKLQLKLDDVNMNSIIEAAAGELRFFFMMRNQHLNLQLDDSIPVVRGDRLRLTQLISNLLGNAIKFTPDGGTITVTSSAKYLLRTRQQESEAVPKVVNIGKEHHLYVEIVVRDTGIGIDLEDQLRIFEKFYEVGKIEEHSSGKVAFKAKGAGLGLAIAKGIVEMHGGEVWVESPGYNPVKYPGSSFHILLPLNPLLGDATLDYMNLLR
ncbi:ATP-binding protein [Geobacter sp. DSM 9736]|uniref:ATP-binding protein n=1 Tax=Geobacter sp. DSM 9736 TaxID=1277350 RepID=UPI000B5049B1|nr:ATP-binding protein [Geobacter sp. DSM 9736]SNB45583.1 PAS/PAC sensor signal transduction histidine kinase [Geobacter sp. DSM 9736]